MNVAQAYKRTNKLFNVYPIKIKNYGRDAFN